VAILAGFPVSLVFAWMFDLRAGRVTRTMGGEEETRRTRVVAWLALALALATAAALGWLLLG